MLTKIYTIVIMLSSVALLLHTAPFAFAEGPVPLGGRCIHTDECGINTGCRNSELGDYKVCKISVPNQSGCDVPQNENLCADNMVCKNNKCKLTFGIKQLEDTGTTASTTTPRSARLLGFMSKLSFSNTELLATGIKAMNVILALAFLVGLTCILRGGLTYRTAIGHVPLQSKGMSQMGMGTALAILSIVLWLLFG